MLVQIWVLEMLCNENQRLLFVENLHDHQKEGLKHEIGVTLNAWRAAKDAWISDTMVTQKRVDYVERDKGMRIIISRYKKKMPYETHWYFKPFFHGQKN